MKTKLLIIILVSISVILTLKINNDDTLLAQSSYSYRWSINGNQYEGVLEYNVRDSHVSGKIYGQTIKGYQVGRHLVFYRYTGDGQIWTGWISERSGTISGNFSHKGENSYPWFGKRL